MQNPRKRSAFRAASPRGEVSVGESLLTRSRNPFYSFDQFTKDEQLLQNFNAHQLTANDLIERKILVKDGSKQQFFWLCPVPNCNKLFLDRSALRPHIILHFNSKLFKCNIEKCECVFNTVKQLNEHIVKLHSVTADKEYFPNDEPNIEENQSKSTLKIIDEALAAVGMTGDRLKTTTVSQECHWICPYEGCNLTFKTLYLVKNHLMIHYDLKPFKCTHGGCKWAFRTLYKLNCHSTVHKIHAKVTYACTYTGCNKKFTTKYNLSVHKNNHDRLRAHRLTCPAKECNKSFPIRKELENHLKFDHLPQHALHKCSSCEKRFWWLSSLAVHTRIHAQSDGDPVCRWPGCGRRFALPCHLRYHLRTHTGDRPYRCTFPSCDWAFSSSGKLRRHAQGHEVIKKRPYGCEICGHSFLRSDHLKDHLSRHFTNSVRKVQCDFPECKKIFADKSSAYTHKKQDHALKTNGTIENLSEQSSIQFKISEEEILSLRSARTHVPWDPDRRSQLCPSSLLHQNNCEEKHGNPLVCGGLSLEDGPVANTGMTLEVDESGIMSLSELGSDSLGSSNDLLLQDLSDGVLYASEDDASFRVLFTQ